jgi:hypothetical protein
MTRATSDMPEDRDELPKIAQSRLRHQASPSGIHPDANVLTAFVEGGLGDAERSTTLAHLGTCAECRDIVALSLPEQESNTLNANVGSPVWTWTRMLQWGAVAASVVVVASAVLLLNTRQSRSAEMIEAVSQVPSETAKQTQSPPASPSSTDADISSPKKSKELRESDKEKASGAPKRLESPAVNAPPAIEAKQTNIGGLLKDNAVGSRSDYFSGGAARAPVAANAPYNQEASTAKKSDFENRTADKATNNGAIHGALAPQGRVIQPLNIAPAPAPEQRPATDTEANAEVLSKLATPPPALAKSRAMAKDEKSADKISSASETVEVAAQAAPTNSLAPSDSFMRARFVNETAAWMIDRNGKLLTRRDASGWKEVPVPDNPRLIALIVKMNHIWVGGAKGALYHSADTGKTWTLVKGGWPPDSDIVQLTFIDPQNVSLQTANGERWASDDGGKSWQKK